MRLSTRGEGQGTLFMLDTGSSGERGGGGHARGNDCEWHLPSVDLETSVAISCNGVASASGRGMRN